MSKYLCTFILLLTGVGTIPALVIFVMMAMKDIEDAKKA